MAGPDTSNSLLGNRSGGVSIDHPPKLMVSIELFSKEEEEALSGFEIMVKPKRG